jgi:hypothetical protein
MRSKNVAIPAVCLGALSIVILLWTGTTGAGPPVKEPEGEDAETLAMLDDGFWYQGLLADENGNPLRNTNVNVTFRIYNVSSGGTALDSVVITVNTGGNGLFNEEIDFNNPDLFNGQALYLEAQVQGEASPMTPRQYLRPVPYAMSIRPGAIILADSTSSSYDPVLEVRHEVDSTTGDHDAIYGYSNSAGEGVEGRSEYGSGVYGRRNSGAASSDVAGVYGYSAAASPGVKGNSSGTSSTTSYGGYFTASRRALYAEGGTNYYDAWFDGNQGIYVVDDIAKGGTCSAAVETADDDVRKLYAVESPNVWFEDFGQGQLANGQATVTMEPLFLSTINTEVPYHVFVTPLGDCNGLYVTNKTTTSFEVRELGSGTSDVAFDYRIVALRTGYETVRMERLNEGAEDDIAAPSSVPEPEDP